MSKNEQTKTKPVAYESKYTIEELAEASHAFDTVAIIVRAALKTAGKSEYTMAEATDIIKKFKNKEVKA